MNTTSQHRFDLDWMRVMSIVVVFIFHSMRFFTLEDWSVKNPTTYAIFDRIDGFIGVWMMPFIFVVSGASMYYALSKGNTFSNAGKFIKDKVLRLLVPMLANAFSLSFLQVYLERYSHGVFTGSMIDFVARALANDLSAAIGQPVVVETKSGGGDVVASLFTAKAAPPPCAR